MNQAILGQQVEGMRLAVRKHLQPQTALTKLISDTGVSSLCPLLRLDYFDPIRDAPLDVMHTLHGNVQRVIQLLSRHRSSDVQNAEVNAAFLQNQPDDEMFTYLDVCDVKSDPSAFQVLWSDNTLTWVDTTKFLRDARKHEGGNNAITQYQRRRRALRESSNVVAPENAIYVDIIGHKTDDHARSHYRAILADGTVAWDRVCPDSLARNIDVVVSYERRCAAIQQPITNQHGAFVKRTEDFRISKEALVSADGRLELIPQPPTLLPWSCRSALSTQAGRMKMHDSLVWCEHWAEYNLGGLLSAEGERILFQYINLLRRLVARDIRLSHVREFERITPIALSQLELLLPVTEFPILVHALLHVPAQMSWFGPVKNTWMFTFERFLIVVTS